MAMFPKAPVLGEPPWKDVLSSGGSPREDMLNRLAEIAGKNREAAKHYFDQLVTYGVIGNGPYTDTVKVGPLAPKPRPAMHPIELIFARLRIPNPPMGNVASLPNIDHVSTYIKGSDVAIVFIVKGGKAITLEDDPGLFPSDALVTQLRLLMADPAPTK